MFVYTQHAKLRLQQRKINNAEIESAVLSPNEILPSFGNCRIARKRIEAETLEVVFKSKNEDIVIITAYWLQKEEQ